MRMKIKSFFEEEFFHSSVVQWTLIGALLLNLVCWAASIFFIRPVDFPIVLHYNVYFGVDMIGDWWKVYLLSGMGLAMLLLNICLGLFFYRRKERIIAHVLLLGGCILQICIAIAMAGVILINY